MQAAQASGVPWAGLRPCPQSEDASEAWLPTLLPQGPQGPRGQRTAVQRLMQVAPLALSEHYYSEVQLALQGTRACTPHSHTLPHAHAPGLPTVSPRGLRTTSVPAGWAALFLPRTHGAPPAHSALRTKVPFCPLDPGSQGPLEPWAQPCPHLAGRPLWFGRTIRKHSRDFRRACHHTCVHCTHMWSGQETRDNGIPGPALLGAQPGRG